ncbi:MAG TPA: MarR family winged helix-turn-helix transcriptional regulator [Verrucomicrobiae bacterium]|nr:MarR family winged helix-turn-helix transcriptional regulator [Verrucomicrobiae bacterium]
MKKAEEAEKKAKGRTPRKESTKRAFRTYLEVLDTADWLRGKLRGQLEYFDLRMREFRLLETLYHDGPQYQQELAERVGCGGQGVVRMVRYLERWGWVKREAANLAKAADNERAERGRAVMVVELTEVGRKHLEFVFPKHTKVVKCYMRALEGREQETLGRLLRKLRAGDAVEFLREMSVDEGDEELRW